MIVQCAECKTSFRLNDELVPPRSVKVRCAKCGHVFAIDGREVDKKMAVETPRPAAPAPAPSPAQFGDLQLKTKSPSPASEPLSPPALDLAPPAPAAGSMSPAAQAPRSQAEKPAMPALQFDSSPKAAPAPSATPSPSPSLGAPGDLQLDRSEPAMGTFPAATANRPAATAVETPLASAGETFRELNLESNATRVDKAPVEEQASPQQQRQDEQARRLARALVSDILVYNRDKRDKALQTGSLVQVLAGEIKKSWEVYKERVTPEVANSTNHFRQALNDILADGQQIF